MIVEPIDWSKGTAAEQIFEGLKQGIGSDAQHEYPVDFLMVAGDGRDDEVVFRWANDLQREKTVKHVTTVSLGSRSTEASYTLTQGVTGTDAYFIALNSKSKTEKHTETDSVSFNLGCLSVLQRLANLS